MQLTTIARNRAGWHMASAMLLAWMLAAAPVAGAAQPDAGKEAVRALHGQMRKIVTADGIDERRFVAIGGIEQAISVRGRHADAPLLLFLHGGPGFTATPVAYQYTDTWEEFFTVVHWDQRGSGRTYLANDPAKVAPTITLERMIADAEEVVEYLRHTYGRERIVLVGHSWGSLLGVELAARHPEWFSAYVGMGQVVDMRESESLGYQAVLRSARLRGDAVAIGELEAIAPYPGQGSPDELNAKLAVQRKWLQHDGGYLYGGRADTYGRSVALTPDYTQQEIEAWGRGIAFARDTLWSQFAAYSQLDRRELKVPVVLLQGRHDLAALSPLVERWYDGLESPHKTLVWLEDSAHMPFMEEPGKLLMHLVQDVLPLAQQSAS